MCSDMELWDSQSTLMVQPLKPEDLPIVKMLMQNDICKKASLAFVRDKEEALHGCVSHGDCCITHCCSSCVVGCASAAAGVHVSCYVVQNELSEND